MGEQPGDRKDLQGKPFVGPAGKLVDCALKAAGIDRSKVYLTNAVKHFKWEPRGKRRLHQKPGARDIASCRPWLDAELAAIKPDRVVCLGSTAAQATLGPDFRVTRDRGKEFRPDLGARVFATVHPSSLLRLQPGADKESEFDNFVRDLSSAVA